jgi:predicted transcriptional regulator of viral defense system
MKQLYKLEQLKDLSYFDKNSLSLLTDLSGNTFDSNVKRWLERGLLVKLKNGIYTTGEFLKRNSNREEYCEFIANKLKEPSYLSLEYVLQKYGIISEAVYTFTSVTLKKPKIYRNSLGTFIYRNISDILFSGYEIKKISGFEIRVASKSKALFDFLYYKANRKNELTLDWFKSLRLNLFMLTAEDLSELYQYFNHTGIKKYSILCNFIKDAGEELFDNKIS